VQWGVADQPVSLLAFPQFFLSLRLFGLFFVKLFLAFLAGIDDASLGIGLDQTERESGKDDSDDHHDHHDHHVLELEQRSSI